MLDAVQFALLGLGTGATYALVGQGVVLIYRASGILNFAQGALAMVGAYTFFESTKAGLAKPVALLIAVVLLAILGAAIYWLLMKPLRQASPLVRVIATLGVLLVLQAIASIRYGAATVFVDSWVPTTSLQWGPLLVPQDRLWLTGFAVILTVLLYAVSKATKFGLATTAVSENERAAASVGWSPDLLSAVNWAAGAALAGVAGILITPLTSLSGTSLTWIVVPAMAAALIGGFSSFELTLVAGLAIGILQSEITHYYPEQGFAQSVPLLLIVLVLVVRGRSLPLRSHLIERLPALGSGVIRIRYAGPVAAIALVMIVLFPFNWVVALSSSLNAGMILLSIVVLTGFAGQLSLAQYTIAGVGALVASQLVIAGWPFGFAILAAIGGAVLAGLVFAIPALRARGVNLAIVTLALGLSLQYTVFTNTSIAGGTDGLEVGSQHLFGIDLDTLASPREYAVLCLVALVLVICIVGNVRRSRTGRRLIAVRTNERAAASLGIDVLGAKLYAFGLSAAIAGLGGTLLAFMNPSVYFSIFDPVRSITAVLLAVVGGVGYIIGALFGATLADGGFPGGVIVQNFSGHEWLTLIGGVAVLLILLQDPNGMARSQSVAVKHLLAQISKRIGRSGSAAKQRNYWNEDALDAHERAEESTLAIQNLSVRFGGVIALNDVSFTLRTGEVLGLIGPNGAGKTTLIDAVTGFVKPSGGEVVLGGQSVTGWRAHRRARAGLSRSFQSLELFEDISVLDNIRAAEDRHDGLAYLTSLFYRGESSLSAAAVAAIKAFGLEEDLDKRADELSFGRRRLVSIARAASAAPSFLLLDEPCAGLSETETRETGLLIRELADRWGVGIVLIEHDVSMVMSTCDRVMVLDFGNKIAEGSPDDVRENEAVKEAYLGGSRVQARQGE